MSYVLRPVHADDVEALVALASRAGHGLTNLPKDRGVLAERVAEACLAFEHPPREPGGELYLFVLEELETGALVGTSGVVSKVGGFEPFYSYRIVTTERSSEVLGVHKQVQALHLVAEHSGPCEIGSLFLDPDHRGAGNGRLLSLSRFLYLAEHPERFDPVVIAEMRGVIDEQGRSPFWDALGRHFFEVELPLADALSAVDKRFIADLMPEHPIYVPLLPPEARAVIGRVHPSTEPALALLRSEGFEPSGMVDIFEAGPVVRCALAEIRTVRESRRAVFAAGEPDAAPADAGRHEALVAAPGEEFRVVRASIAAGADGPAWLPEPAARALGVRPGDGLRWAPWRAGS